MSYSDRPIAQYCTFKARSNEYQSTLRQLCEFITELGPDRVINVTEDSPNSSATYFNVLYWNQAKGNQP